MSSRLEEPAVPSTASAAGVAGQPLEPGAGVDDQVVGLGRVGDEDALRDGLDGRSRRFSASRLFPQLGLDLLPLGQVPDDLHEAARPPGLVPRDIVHVGPEPGAVLADPPPLLGEPPGSRRLAQLPHGQPGGRVLGGEEHAPVPADDLVRGPPRRCARPLFQPVTRPSGSRVKMAASASPPRS